MDKRNVNCVLVAEKGKQEKILPGYYLDTNA